MSNQTSILTARRPPVLHDLKTKALSSKQCGSRQLKRRVLLTLHTIRIVYGMQYQTAEATV
jgi:hypothetical protein